MVVHVWTYDLLRTATKKNDVFRVSLFGGSQFFISWEKVRFSYCREIHKAHIKDQKFLEVGTFRQKYVGNEKYGAHHR